MTTSKRATRPAADTSARSKPRQAAPTVPVATPTVPVRTAAARRVKTAGDAGDAGAKGVKGAKKADGATSGKRTATLVDTQAARAPSVRAALATVRPRLRTKVVEAEEGLVSGLVHSIQDLPAKLLARLGTASDLAAVLVKAQMPKPANKALVDQAAHFLRDLREAAQLSLDDLAKALTLEDASLLSLVESGKVGLPFDIILRMATVLGKNDPVGFILKVTRAYNPGIWATLDKLGIGKLVVQAGREREFANIYRANEAARGLNDAEFAAALRFVAAAFDTAVVFQQHANERAGRA